MSVQFGVSERCQNLYNGIHMTAYRWAPSVRPSLKEISHCLRMKDLFGNKFFLLDKYYHLIPIKDNHYPLSDKSYHLIPIRSPFFFFLGKKEIFRKKLIKRDLCGSDVMGYSSPPKSSLLQREREGGGGSKGRKTLALWLIRTVHHLDL